MATISPESLGRAAAFKNAWTVEELRTALDSVEGDFTLDEAVVEGDQDFFLAAPLLDLLTPAVLCSAAARHPGPIRQKTRRFHVDDDSLRLSDPSRWNPHMILSQGMCFMS